MTLMGNVPRHGDRNVDQPWYVAQEVRCKYNCASHVVENSWLRRLGQGMCHVCNLEHGSD